LLRKHFRSENLKQFYGNFVITVELINLVLNNKSDQMSIRVPLPRHLAAKATVKTW